MKPEPSKSTLTFDKGKPRMISPYFHFVWSGSTLLANTVEPQ